MRASVLFALGATSVYAHPPVSVGAPDVVSPHWYSQPSRPAPTVAPSTTGFKNGSAAVSKGGKATCVDGFISVSANTTKGTQFNFAIPPNQTVVTETFLEFITSGSPFTKQITIGPSTIEGTFDIRATLCTPTNNTTPSEVQLLTHGIGFDHSYWDFGPGYSYVDVAAEHGYATLSYDRLAVGQSQKGDPINVVQASLEVEIAHQLAVLLRNGQISGTKYSKVIGVGHSFGSAISEAVTSLYPSVFDGVILTGFSVNSTALPGFVLGSNFALANQNVPSRFGSLNNGYLVDSTIISNQIGFFRFPGFDPKVLAEAEATKESVTFGELFTLGTTAQPAPGFTGPVAVVNGNEDLPYCFGNCSYPTNLAAAVQPMLYPAVTAANFATYLAPVTGHGLNLHYSAETAYEWIQSFLKSHAL